MPQQISGRSYSLRSRAASSAESFDASSTAACSPASVAAFVSLPAEQPPADRQRQAKEAAGRRSEVAVVGDEAGSRQLSSTVSSVRVGVEMHSGQPPVPPSIRFDSESTIPNTATSRSTTARSTLPRYVRGTVVIETVCSVDSCYHCCQCHLRHPNNGYGKCMRRANQPWPDCECAGKCAAGRCAQFECSSTHVIDLTSDSQPDSLPTITTPSATPSQSPSRNSSRRSSDATTASLPPTPPSPQPGVRRDVGGVHTAEGVCTGPRAGTHTSSSEAYRQPSATVNDSRLAASQVVREGNGVEEAAAVSETNVGAAHTTPTTTLSNVDRPLPSAVLSRLPPLSYQPQRLPVIADGRCSVASICLARGVIADDHSTDEGRRVIDAERSRLARQLCQWTVADWVHRVPVVLRAGNRKFVDGVKSEPRHSYDVYHELLTKRPPTTWLDQCVFYLASAEYDIGVLVIYHEQGGWYSRHIGQDKDTHIVIYMASGHYECVEYNGLCRFPSDHEFVTRVAQSAQLKPDYPKEDDVELLALQDVDGPSTATAVDAGHDPAAVTAAPSSSEAEQAPLLMVTPRARRQRQTKPMSVSRNRSQAKARRALVYDTQKDATQPSSAQPHTTSASSDGIRQLPPLVATIAQHGPLYDRVSFHNHSQWRAVNEPLWNAYRLASMTGQRSQLAAILLDILLLPQRVLLKLGRSGRAARRRTVAATSRRFRGEAERLRARFNCPDPDRADEQQMQMSADTMVNTAALGGLSRPQRAAFVAAREAIRQQAADTTDAGSDVDSDAETKQAVHMQADGEDDESDNPYPSLSRSTSQRPNDPDNKAAKRATYLVQCGLTRKAAQVLHSTTQVADMRAAEVQQTMLLLHPQQLPGTVLPALPQQAPPSVLEDDGDLRKLLLQSDNGTAAGPSGWGGNMLAILERSDICRLGVMALLRDIMNGDLPDEARDLLLTSRLVALTKPNSDGYRPIAVGELFYRLAAIVAVRRVSKQAAQLLAPHQYGIGVAAGAEKIVHSLQHELTDTDKRLAMLQLDIANAFNNCDRARLLRELYALPDLQPLFRLANFAYAQPSVLVLSGCDDKMIESAQGVRQGDPLSALLFCVYMKEMLQQLSDQTGVRVYGFFDDINLTGTPQQLMAALDHLQHSLPTASLQLNTDKSHFTYFHDHLTPLTAQTLSTLSANNIQLHHDWVGVVGAAVGRTDASIRTGMHSVLAATGNYDTFLRRVRLDDVPMHTALMLLRVCLVPAMNYYLRCIAPTCVEEEAQRFDQQVIEAARDKLGLQGDKCGEGMDTDVTTLLQRKLRDGGAALIPAARTSPAAFLGSLATCCAEPAFAPYCGATPLPHTSPLHGWIDDSMRRVRQVAVSDEYQADIEPLLPATAGTFFSFCCANSSATTNLQRSLNAKATSHIVEAAVERMKERSKRGDKWALAHHKAVTTKGAWGWKVVRPEDPYSRLSDVECAIATRLNLGLTPFPARATELLPEHCPFCRHQTTGLPVSLRDEPWHFLTCSQLRQGQCRRHDGVVDAIARVALLVGAQVRKEVEGLDQHSKQRPDLEIVFPGRVLLADVVVSHSLTSSRTAQHRSTIAIQQGQKVRKYAHVASRLGAELLNVSADTCGGLASDAFKLMRAIAEEGEKWSAGTWSSARIERQLLGAIAIAVQRGNATIMLTGYTRATSAQTGGARRRVEKEAVSEGRLGSDGVETGEEQRW